MCLTYFFFPLQPGVCVWRKETSTYLLQSPNIESTRTKWVQTASYKKSRTTCIFVQSQNLLSCFTSSITFFWFSPRFCSDIALDKSDFYRLPPPLSRGASANNIHPGRLASHPAACGFEGEELAQWPWKRPAFRCGSVQQKDPKKRSADRRCLDFSNTGNS